MSVHGPDSIYAIAPRLALAMDQHNNAILMVRHRLRLARSELVDVERLVVHRDLQLLRACATRSRRYVTERARKLEHAERRRSRLRAEIDQLQRDLAA